jgi:hypothetical protein
MTSVRQLLARAAVFAESRAGALTAFLAAFGVWWMQAIAMPLTGGADFGTYVGAYVELFQSDPIDLGYVLGRTPVAPLVTGLLLDPFGGALAEPAMALLYAGSILAWFLAARRFGGGAAILTTLVLLAYPGYGILFHEIASDSVFAMVFAGWSLLAVRVILAPSARGFVLLGAGVGLLALVRPLNLVLVALALLALIVGASWRTRLGWAIAFVAPVVVILGAWTVHNGVRFDDYTVSRAGNTNWPIYRVYLFDKLVRPDNGSSSREIAKAVEEDLLPFEPYRSYGITLERFFENPTARFLEDLGALSNRRWGWESDQKILRDVAFEAIRTHPGSYAWGVTSTVWGLLRKPYFRSLEASGGDTGQSGGSEGDTGPSIVVNGRVLPRPTEGEAIPGAREGGITTPDNSIRTVWTSASERHLVFDHPGDEARYEALHRRMDEIAGGLPDRSGVGVLALRLNQMSRWFPPPVLWLLVAIGARAVRRPKNVLALAAPALAALVVVFFAAAGAPSLPRFSVPVMPAFALLMSGSLLGPRRPNPDPGR